MAFSRTIARMVAAMLVCGAWGGGEPARAASSLENELQLWTPVYLTAPLHGDVMGYAEVNPRVGNDLQDMSQLLLRPAVGYQLTRGTSVWQGYAWVASFLPVFRTEHRAFQQVIHTRAWERVKLLSRSRFEERFLEDARGVSLRARTMLRADVPFPRAREWALAVYDEVFVNLNSIHNGPEAGFDQNRFFVGVNQRLGRGVNVDLGYQLQLINTGRSGLANLANHMILVQTFLSW